MAEEAPHLKSSNEPLRRLNDYDSDLLREDAYKDVKDELFRLEYKISKTEDEIKALEGQMSAAAAVGDDELTARLKDRLITLREDYTDLLELYNDKSLSAKITGRISTAFGGKWSKTSGVFKNCLSKIYNFFISKLPKKITAIVEIKDSLGKLANINKSVDNLISMNIPYGENIDKYKQLSRYIIKANSIQSEISKQINK